MKLHLNEKKPANSIIKGRTKRTRNEPKWRGTLADWNKVKWNGMRWNDTHQLGTLLRWSQVTPIKPKMFPHSAMPFGRPRSVDLMSRSLNPSLDGLVRSGVLFSHFPKMNFVEFKLLISNIVLFHLYPRLYFSYRRWNFELNANARIIHHQMHQCNTLPDFPIFRTRTLLNSICWFQILFF